MLFPSFVCNSDYNRVNKFCAFQDTCDDRLLVRGEPGVLRRAGPAGLGDGRVRRREHWARNQGQCANHSAPFKVEHWVLPPSTKIRVALVWQSTQDIKVEQSDVRIEQCVTHTVCAFVCARQVWLCGGSMEVLPCSRVAHIARTKKPYHSNIAFHTRRNALRVAEVWMDEYKSNVYLAWNIPMEVRGTQTQKRAAGSWIFIVKFSPLCAEPWHRLRWHIGADGTEEKPPV